MVVRVRRQTVSEVDAPAIEELAVRRDRHQHRRVRVLCNANGRSALRSSFRHVSPPRLRPRVLSP
jgi:hypothetical protein